MPAEGFGLQPHACTAEIFAKDFATLFAATAQQVQSLQQQPHAMFPMPMPMLMQQQALAMQQPFGMLPPQQPQELQPQQPQEKQQPQLQQQEELQQQFGGQDLPGRSQGLGGFQANVCAHGRMPQQYGSHTDLLGSNTKRNASKPSIPLLNPAYGRRTLLGTWRLIKAASSQAEQSQVRAGSICKSPPNLRVPFRIRCFRESHYLRNLKRATDLGNYPYQELSKGNGVYAYRICVYACLTMLADELMHP